MGVQRESCTSLDVVSNLPIRKDAVAPLEVVRGSVGCCSNAALEEVRCSVQTRRGPDFDVVNVPANPTAFAREGRNDDALAIDRAEGYARSTANLTYACHESVLADLYAFQHPSRLHPAMTKV